MPLEESGASVSLLSALAPSDPGQKSSFQPPPAVCSTSSRPEAPDSPPCSSTPSPSLLTCSPSLSPLSHALSPNKAHVSRAQVHNLELKEPQWPIKKRQLFLRTSTKGAQEPCSVWVSTATRREAVGGPWVELEEARMALGALLGLCLDIPPLLGTPHEAS